MNALDQLAANIMAQEGVSGYLDNLPGVSGMVELPVGGFVGQEWIGEEWVEVEDLSETAGVGASVIPKSAALNLMSRGFPLRINRSAPAPRAPAKRAAAPAFAFRPGAVPYMPSMVMQAPPGIGAPQFVGPQVSGPTVLPLDSGAVALPAGGDAVIVANPLFITRGTKLVVSPAIATTFEIGNPSVGGMQGWAGGGTVPGDCFPPNADPNALTPSMNPSQGLQLPVSNIGGAPARFRGYYAVEGAR